MATYLLDTNALSALMNEEPRPVARATALHPTDRAVINTVVRGEILYGLARMPHGRRRRELEAKAAHYFARIPCEGISEAVADVYARIKLDCEQNGTPLDENDLWIAAAALERGAALVTSDTDFGRVSGLRTEDWTR
ncbi:MAG: type II toxin-antitoxin system VapC family toxin [Planctomycetes bacterium]|nr:type II toxin-antitoxin system VapC family toxin [Planctomycetota bacterium]